MKGNNIISCLGDIFRFFKNSLLSKLSFVVTFLKVCKKYFDLKKYICTLSRDFFTDNKHSMFYRALLPQTNINLVHLIRTYTQARLI